MCYAVVLSIVWCAVPEPVIVPPSIDHVLVCDVNNDLHLDLFGVRYVHDAGNSTSRPDDPSIDFDATERAYWINVLTTIDGVNQLAFDVVAQNINSSPSSRYSQPELTPSPTLASPQSHAWVDLDGDCMADLVVTSQSQSGTDADSTASTKFIEIWINHWRDGPTLHSINPLPAGSGQLSFADVDSDGNMDLIVPILTPNHANNEIRIYYNRAKQLCGSLYDFAGGESNKPDADGIIGCRPEMDLCQSDPNFFFDFMHDPRQNDDGGATSGSASDTDSSGLVIYRFPASTTGGHLFDPYNPQSAPWQSIEASPLTLRFGDINLDGWPDLLVTLTPVDGANYGVANLWLNVPCQSSGGAAQTMKESVVCSPRARARGRRVFSASSVSQANKLLSSTAPGAFAGATFFDIGDDGYLDVLLTSIQPPRNLFPTRHGPEPGTHVSRAFINGFDTDAYFLTTLSSNGVCPAWCDTEPKFPNPKPYGVNMVGATFKYVLTDLGGVKRIGVGCQLVQSSYLSLPSPSSTFGLGRSNTFIDTFAYGLALNRTTHWRSWLSLVPNAQIIVFPYPPSNPDEWTAELFVAPSQQLVWVVISWAATLTIIALIIGYLHLKEKREDEKEKRKHELLFTF